jgi:prophage regulatory protein
MSDHPNALKKLLRLPEVQTATGLSRSAIYDMASRGHVPSPIKIGPRASAWVGVEVDAWIEQKIAERMKS